YSAPPPSQSTSAANMSCMRMPSKTSTGSTSAVNMDSDWVATTLTSQLPLSPADRLGLFCCTVSAARTPYMMVNHSTTAAAQNASAIAGAANCNTIWLPTTPVAETQVKKPTPRAWL